MEGERSNFFKVCVAIFVSLSYCYGVGKTVSKGTKRLLSVLPIVFLFLFLPLSLSSINCGGITGFFISWLANFKLLLFAFGKGPLIDNSNSTSIFPLWRFIAYACFPIEIRHKNPLQKTTSRQVQKWLLIYVIKVLLLAILVLRFSDYENYMHQKVVLFLYCLYVYLVLDIILATTSAAARAIWGLDLEPHFNEPYLSSSLQDFWGRRWNLMVGRALRPAVYEPTLGLWAGLVGRKWAPIPAVLGTFAVSGLMHELIFYYWARVWPTWEVTRFFLLHGTCLAAEIAVKKAVGTTKWWPPRAVTGILAVGFVMETCFRMMFPQVLRCNADVRLLEEYAAIGAFLRGVAKNLALIFS
ncbi:acyl-CoA--sterol O-acyltransferase 1-like [Morus notabilis]|uniref:acyl-CoA--sterol O-acyltransferase 1-like n=1 Tax=Morus notabilis TaxID=981085 RepID=UPI000CED1F68|nr:acyl-CoA--sterol O-acyltransferase 1-like [Morus notabilis]